MKFKSLPWVVITIILVNASISSADVFPVDPDDRYVIQVGRDLDTQRIHFTLCDLSSEDLKTPINCRPMGSLDGYTIESLESQRRIEKTHVGALWTGAVIAVAAGAGTGWVVAAIGTAPVGGITTSTAISFMAPSAVLAATPFALVKALNPLNQHNDVKVLDEDVLNDHNIEVSKKMTVYEFALRLERILSKIDKKQSR